MCWQTVKQQSNPALAIASAVGGKRRKKPKTDNILTNEIKLELFADYFQFYIQDEEVDGDLSDSWTDEAVEILLATTAGTIGVGTVRNMDVPVTLKTYETQPEFLLDPENTIGQINECDIEISSGKLVLAGCTDYFPEAERIVLEKGNYRARIYYGNLDKISEDGLDGDDFYEIHLWKTDRIQELKVIKDRNASRQ